MTMMMFTPYINSDMYTERVPAWQRLERYEYCSQPMPEKKGSGALKRFISWLR